MPSSFTPSRRACLRRRAGSRIVPVRLALVADGRTRGRLHVAGCGGFRCNPALTTAIACNFRAGMLSRLLRETALAKPPGTLHSAAQSD